MRDLSEFFDLVPSFANNAASLTLVNQKTYLKVIRPLQNDNAQLQLKTTSQNTTQAEVLTRGRTSSQTNLTNTENMYHCYLFTVLNQVCFCNMHEQPKMFSPLWIFPHPDHEHWSINLI